MAFSHGEILAFIKAEVEELTLLCSARPNRKKHLDESDDEYKFVENSLERWGDRQMPKDDAPSIHLRLEREADRILATAH